MYTIELFKKVSAQKSYDNVRWFKTLAAQETYFNGLEKKTLINCSPIIDESMFLCNGNVNDYRNYTYMRFWYTDDNGNEKKKVYCFIDDVQYRNKDTFRLYYTIDSFQTYMLDLKINSVFVEREHVSNDSIGANIIDEGLSTDELVCNKTEAIETSQRFYVVVNTTIGLSETHPSVSGGIYNGILSAGKWYAYDYQSTHDFKAFKNDLQSLIDSGKSEGIISIFLVPQELISLAGDDTHIVKDSETIDYTNYEYDLLSSLDGYKPKNKKLLTYPYVAIRLSNNNGVFRELRPERFDDGKAKFRVVKGANSNVSYLCIPIYYNGTVVDFRYSTELAPFPQFSWTNNPYATWLNQNALSIASNVVQGTVSGAIGGMIAGGAYSAIGGGLLGGFSSALSSMITGYSYAQKPLSAQGTQSGNVLLSIANVNDFKIEFLSCKSEIAKSIDDYFTRYGYKVNRNKIPNINTRNDYNFVKTCDCDFTGNIPHKYLTEILTAFDRGITLWHQDF